MLNWLFLVDFVNEDIDFGCCVVFVIGDEDVMLLLSGEGFVCDNFNCIFWLWMNEVKFDFIFG